MKITDWEKRVQELEGEGLTRSDAESQADAEVNAKITPGPWATSRDAVPPGHVQITVYAEAGGRRVATVFQTNANAALIAAAPELLEALKVLLNMAYSRGDIGQDEAAWVPPIDAARAALAKAEGNA